MRMRGHAEHDDMKYVPPALLEEWARKDPILRYEEALLAGGTATREELDGLTAEVDRTLGEDLAFAEQSPFPDADSGLSGVYADREVASPIPSLVAEWEKRQGQG
jgi:TPP-dependent pyruvate/acetoin dehydrogenase alpha subunit